MRAAALLALALVAGCDRYDVQHYIDHPDERKALLIECRNRPASVGMAPDCLHANEAERRAMFSGSDMPAIR